MVRQLTSILVGDHLGQVRKVLWPSGEVAVMPGLAEPDITNPIISIQPIGERANKHLICSKNGDLFIHDSVKGEMKRCDNKCEGSLVKALPINDKDMVFVFEKHLSFVYANKSGVNEVKQKKGQIKDAKYFSGKLAIVGKDIPLRVFDVKSRNKIYDANFPERNWLGIQPECDVMGLDFVGPDRVVTCSKSDSVIRVYDIKTNKTTPIISVELNQTAFNEYAEAGRFMSISSATQSQSSNTGVVVVGSNVGQLIAIELKFNLKQLPKKKLQPKTYKILGCFKGSRGATYKDVKIIEAGPSDPGSEYKVISCCLDRYLRIHSLSRKRGRHLDKHVYMKTKPMCCSPVFYSGSVLI